MSKQALEGTRLNAFAVDPDDLTIIGLDTDDGPEHPLWDERIRLPVNENLGLDLSVLGNTQNIVVRKNGERVEVVVGRQRVKAARWVNQQLRARGAEPVKLKATVEKGDSARLMGMRIGENRLRHNGGPMAQARELQRYLALGRSLKEAEVTFNAGAETLRLWGLLLDLHDDVQAAVDSEQVSASAAVELARFSQEEQVKLLAELLASGKVTAATVRSRTGRGPRGPSRRLLTAVAELAWDSPDEVPTESAEVLLWAAGRERDRNNLPEWLVKLIAKASTSLKKKTGDEPTEEGADTTTADEGGEP